MENKKISVEYNQLEVGRLYEVILQDCCIEGDFTSKVKEIDKDDNVLFENGVTLCYTRYGCLFYEIETENNPIF
jgi:hypothetical protein